ncbi:hypothetical protein [Sporomusa sp.]|nr:hypothetical protein [Sporomusa sp.]HWR41830.1 hypothetical protein [Sporomusa sp.]
MPTFRIIINGEPTENVVTGATYIDAYFLAVQTVPQAYKNDFKLEQEESE